MNEDFITFEIAKKLKEKGFDWETSNVYERNILACRYEDYPKPTISQVFKWLRDEQAIYIEIVLWEKGWYSDVVVYEYYEEENEYSTKVEFESEDFNTYEEAALAGIEYVLDKLI